MITFAYFAWLYKRGKFPHAEMLTLTALSDVAILLMLLAP